MAQPRFLDDLIAKLGGARPTKMAHRLYDDAVESGIFIDHAKALYGPDPADHMAVEFGRSASPDDIDALRGLIYQRSQQRLADMPEVLQVFRGDRLNRRPEDVLSFSGSRHVANRFARPLGEAPAGSVGMYVLPRRAILADAGVAPGTFAESELLSRLADASLLQSLPWSPPAYP